MSTIGVAVIGAGHWGPNLIRNFHDHPLSAVRWVIERDASRLDAVGARFPGVRFRRYTGSVGWLMRHCTAEDADRIASEVQAVVGTTND